MNDQQHAQIDIAHLGGPFADYIGLQWHELTGDRVACSWEVTENLQQPWGIVHGGVHCTVFETLASVAATLWLGDRGTVVGVNNNTDFLRGVSTGTMTSTGTPLHRGRSQQLWLVDTISEDGRLVARGQVRLQNLYPSV